MGLVCASETGGAPLTGSGPTEKPGTQAGAGNTPGCDYQPAGTLSKPLDLSDPLFLSQKKRPRRHLPTWCHHAESVRPSRGGAWPGCWHMGTGSGTRYSYYHMWVFPRGKERRPIKEASPKGHHVFPLGSDELRSLPHVKKVSLLNGNDQQHIFAFHTLVLTFRAGYGGRCSRNQGRGRPRRVRNLIHSVDIC